MKDIETIFIQELQKAQSQDRAKLIYDAVQKIRLARMEVKKAEEELRELRETIIDTAGDPLERIFP